MKCDKILTCFLIGILLVKAEIFKNENEFKELIDVESQVLENFEKFVGDYRKNLNYLEM